jgi:hypothetical protein
MAMAYRWPADTCFTRLELDVDDRACRVCGRPLKVCDHRPRRLFTFDGPLQVVRRLVHCADPTCLGRGRTYSPEARTALALPWWVLGWDVFCWLGEAEAFKDAGWRGAQVVATWEGARSPGCC